MQRRWQVSLVVVATFVASLDLFIVNIAFPDIRADFGGARRCRRCRGCSTPTRSCSPRCSSPPAGWPTVGRRAVPRRPGSVLARLAVRLAPSGWTLVAARRPGGRRARCCADLARAAAARVPAAPSGRRDRHLGGVGAVAAAAGPPLGGLLVQADWRLVFLVNLPVGAWALWRGARLLTETRDPTGRAAPTGVGAAVLAAVVGARARLRAGARVGLGRSAHAGRARGRRGRLALFARRCARHPSPVVDPAMLRVRSFAMANVAAILFSAGVRRDAALQRALHDRGVAGVDPERRPPARPRPGAGGDHGGRLEPAHEPRRPAPAAGIGCTLFALGMPIVALLADATPDYASELLPGCSSPASASASRCRASTAQPPRRCRRRASRPAPAVVTMSRQLGIALGVAVLVAVLGTPAPGAVLDAFREGWTFQIVAALLGGRRPRHRRRRPRRQPGAGYAARNRCQYAAS